MGRYKDLTLLWSVEPKLDENIIRKGVTTNQWQSVGDVLEKLWLSFASLKHGFMKTNVQALL